MSGSTDLVPIEVTADVAQRAVTGTVDLRHGELVVRVRPDDYRDATTQPVLPAGLTTLSGVHCMRYVGPCIGAEAAEVPGGRVLLSTSVPGVVAGVDPVTTKRRKPTRGKTKGGQIPQWVQAKEAARRLTKALLADLRGKAGQRPYQTLGPRHRWRLRAESVAEVPRLFPPGSPRLRLLLARSCRCGRDAHRAVLPRPLQPLPAVRQRMPRPL